MQGTWEGLKTVSNYTKKKVDSEIEIDVDKVNARFDVG